MLATADEQQQAVIQSPPTVERGLPWWLFGRPHHERSFLAQNQVWTAAPTGGNSDTRVEIPVFNETSRTDESLKNTINGGGGSIFPLPDDDPWSGSAGPDSWGLKNTINGGGGSIFPLPDDDPWSGSAGPNSWGLKNTINGGGGSIFPLPDDDPWSGSMGPNHVWTAAPPNRVWTAAPPSRVWTAAPPNHVWTAAPNRVWTAAPPNHVWTAVSRGPQSQAVWTASPRMPNHVWTAAPAHENTPETAGYTVGSHQLFQGNGTGGMIVYPIGEGVVAFEDNKGLHFLAEKAPTHNETMSEKESSTWQWVGSWFKRH